jgi:hypothetical protein
MTEGVTSLILNETDRELVELAAWILMSLDPGPTREDAGETIAQAYRDDVAEAHAGTAPDALDELAVGFSGALLLKIERVSEDRAEMNLSAAPQTRIVSPADRRRVIEAIGRYLEMVKPIH